MSPSATRSASAFLLSLTICVSLVVQEAGAQCVSDGTARKCCDCDLSYSCADEACERGCFRGCSVRRTTLTDDWWWVRPCLEDHGITFEGAVTQFYQGVASGGSQREFRYGGHGDYGLDLDLGKLCGLGGFTVELGAEHRFAETVNQATGSVVPVALLPNLPEPETYSLALTEIRFNVEVQEDVEVFFGKLDTLIYDRNAFADGKGAEKFFSTAFNYNPIATRTVPFSTLGGGINVIRDGEPVFTLAVFDTEDTGTIIAIDELFSRGIVIFTELRLPVTFMGRRGHQAIIGSWSSRTFASLDQTGRIGFPDILIAKKEGSWAFCWNADQFLWQDPCDESRGWGVFGRAGISDGNPNPIKWFLSFGVGGQSRLPGRQDDTFGVGWYYTGISDEFGPIVSNLLGDGQGVELYYDIAMTEWVHVTPDLQIVAPNEVLRDTAFVAGLRARIDF